VGQAGTRAGEPVPGVVEDAQPLRWGFETYDSLVDMEETARTYGVELAGLEAVAGRMFLGGGLQKPLEKTSDNELPSSYP
jgi:hypothetical protein